jgi:hypothetical protein
MMKHQLHLPHPEKKCLLDSLQQLQHHHLRRLDRLALDREKFLQRILDL